MTVSRSVRQPPFPYRVSLGRFNGVLSSALISASCSLDRFLALKSDLANLASQSSSWALIACLPHSSNPWSFSTVSSFSNLLAFPAESWQRSVAGVLMFPFDLVLSASTRKCQQTTAQCLRPRSVSNLCLKMLKFIMEQIFCPI